MKRGEIPTVSFDFAYTRAEATDGTVQNTDQVIALIMVDSHTNYTGWVPVKAKSQFDLMVREFLQFTQVFGHGEICYLCDNEPSIRQVQARAVRARLAQGLATHDKTPAYSSCIQSWQQFVREYSWKNAQPCRFPDVSVAREDLLGTQYKQQHLVLGDASCQLAVKLFLCDARRYAI